MIVELSVLLLPKARAAGCCTAAPVNIGVDKVDAKMPDMGVYRSDTERNSPAFLTSAEMVIEILPPKEKAGEKLPFYAGVGVAEYLEIDLPAGTCRLLANHAGTWIPIERSSVIDLQLSEITTLL